MKGGGGLASLIEMLGRVVASSLSERTLIAGRGMLPVDSAESVSERLQRHSYLPPLAAPIRPL
jgi:hypothetical protein